MVSPSVRRTEMKGSIVGVERRGWTNGLLWVGDAAPDNDLGARLVMLGDRHEDGCRWHLLGTAHVNFGLLTWMSFLCTGYFVRDCCISFWRFIDVCVLNYARYVLDVSPSMNHIHHGVKIPLPTEDPPFFINPHDRIQGRISQSLQPLVIACHPRHVGQIQIRCWSVASWPSKAATLNKPKFTTISEKP